MQVAVKKAVTIKYTLRDEEGAVLDSTEGRDPLTYLHGAGNLVPGVEEALEGKSAGDEIKVTVPPEKGYGARATAAAGSKAGASRSGPSEARAGCACAKAARSTSTLGACHQSAVAPS